MSPDFPESVADQLRSDVAAAGPPDRPPAPRRRQSFRGARRRGRLLSRVQRALQRAVSLESVNGAWSPEADSLDETSWWFDSF